MVESLMASSVKHFLMERDCPEEIILNPLRPGYLNGNQISHCIHTYGDGGGAEMDVPPNIKGTERSEDGKQCKHNM